MSMSRRNYEEIARILKRGLDTGDMGLVITEMANMLKQDNSRFKEDKFFEACGYTYREAQQR